MITWSAISKFSPSKPASEKLIAIWFVICGFIHSVLELYYVLRADSITSDMSLLGQIWKEYAQSDSRYLTKDPTVWSIEAVTALIEGPACFITAYAITYNKPYRHSLQFSISLGQLYGKSLWCVLT